MQNNSWTEDINKTLKKPINNDDGRLFKVTLSIGTEIKCTVASYSSFITMISVKPSIYDVKDARGLCGVPSVTKDPSDDFYHRDKGPISDDQEFARSWKILQTISPNEQLFIPDPHFLTEDSNPEIENDNQNANLSAGMYCVCEKQAEPNDEDFYTSQCSLSDSTEYCSSGTQSGPGNSIPSNPVVTTCTSNMQNRSLSLRTRRSVTDNDDIVLDTIPLEYDDDVNDNVTEPDYTDEWTEEKANLTCTDRIMKAIPSDLPDVPGLTDIDYIKSCMLDIKNTGGTTFVEDTIGALQTKAIMELSRNQTLMITKTDNNGSQSILDYVKGLLCPNNCSGNGTCTSGVCLCNEGYNGDDCLEESSKPPLNIEIPANGLCGIIERECRRTNVYGIFNAKTVWCRRRHFQILKGSHVVMSDQDTIQADYRNRYMVSVDLQSARRKRSVSGDVLAEGFELSFSNDEKEFGGIVNVVIYNEQCFTCNATSKECYPVVSCPVTTTELPETIIGNTI
ncbi:uncharacterized protein LOC134705260 [Mytilus trossulus]|uniref:uncharacterized protein LOC134705260 n=1 Tax=Mytilus trossulus TaxID=6551 RepID=UPI003006865D